VVLLIGELVTNAVVHGHGPVGLRVTLDETDGILRCEVTDASPQLPRPGPASDDAESGRGLMLVAALAASHGWQPAAAGKTVWFTYPLSGDGRPAIAAPLRPAGGDDPREELLAVLETAIFAAGATGFLSRVASLLPLPRPRWRS
jgi:hypothetical protein